ncbi:MAG TPA: Gfo/Idh/MocA family oxidoreductase [Planctomycetota bacterium]|nr:Gfo/Idh/MocA family oxidoreductase [Planctomycetota bacterium]
MIGIGLIGAGLHGSRYAAHLAQGDVEGVKLVALSRRDRLLGEQKAREHRVRYHPTVEELVHDRDVTAVLVATPADHHAAAVRAAVRAHKPVLVEKPLTHSLDEARALLRDTREGRVMVAQTLRWEPVYKAALAEAIALGPIAAAQAIFIKGDFTRRRTADSLTTEHHRAVYACGIHHLDWAGQLFPSGFARVHAHEARGEDGLSFAALLEARDGGTFTLTVRLVGEGTQDAFSVQAARGAIAGDRVAHRLERSTASGTVPLELPPRAPTLPQVLASFRDYVLGKTPNPVPLEQGVRAVARAEACVRSIGLGRAIEINEET